MKPMPIQRIEDAAPMTAAPAAVSFFAMDEHGRIAPVGVIPYSAFDPNALVQLLSLVVSMLPQLAALVAAIVAVFRPTPAPTPVPNPPSPPNPGPGPAPKPFGTSR